MPPIRSSPRPSDTPLFLVALGAMLVALLLLLIPAVPSGGAGASPNTFPGMMPRLGCNNLKTNDVFKVSVHCGPQSVVAVLGSVEGSPVAIGPWNTSLASDWFVLQPPTSIGGSDQLHLEIPVPDIPWIVGVPLVFQAAVLDPSAPDVQWSSPVFVRATQGSQNGMKNVVVVRQTTNAPGMTNAAAQATALVGALAGNGHVVAMVDNALPSDLRNYDAILDLRFTLTPPASETAALAAFMIQGGGVFFVCGPWAGCPQGQQRAAWIHAFLNVTLGTGAFVGSGGNLSGTATEAVALGADAAYRNFPLSISGLWYQVSNEGGNFGPPTAMTAGTPWITGSSALGMQTYGALFTPADYGNFFGQGRVAVLFSGSSAALTPTFMNPNAQAVFENLVHWLDR